MKELEKFGYTIERWDGSNRQYRHVEIVVWRARKTTYSHHWLKDRFVRFTWQTDRQRFAGNLRTWRLWYALNVAPASDQLNYVEDVNAFANFMRKLIRRLERQSLSNATPAQLIEALEAMKAKLMVTDARDNNTVLFVDEVAPADHIAFNLREPDIGDNTNNYVIDRFFAATEDEAKDQALQGMAKRASGKGTDHKYVKQLIAWVSDGMPLERVYADAPDLRSARERINDGMVYVDYYDQIVDDCGVQLVDETAVNEIDDALAVGVDFFEQE